MTPLKLTSTHPGTRYAVVPTNRHFISSILHWHSSFANKKQAPDCLCGSRNVAPFLQFPILVYITGMANIQAMCVLLWETRTHCCTVRETPCTLLVFSVLFTNDLSIVVMCAIIFSNIICEEPLAVNRKILGNKFFVVFWKILEINIQGRPLTRVGRNIRIYFSWFAAVFPGNIFEEVGAVSINNAAVW